MTKNIDRVTGKGVFPHQYAWTLLIPLRNLLLSPRKLLKVMNVRDDARVLEIGPGPGYFSVPVARSIPKGRLYLTDIQPEMLDKARKRLARRRITNVEFKMCDGNSLQYEDSFFDAVFMITVLGEVANQDAYLKDIKRVLKPGGTVTIGETYGDPDNMSRSEVTGLLEKYGFTLQRYRGGQKNYVATFVKITAREEE